MDSAWTVSVMIQDLPGIEKYRRRNGGKLVMKKIPVNPFSIRPLAPLNSQNWFQPTGKKTVLCSDFYNKTNKKQKFQIGIWRQAKDS